MEGCDRTAHTHDDEERTTGEQAARHFRPCWLVVLSAAVLALGIIAQTGSVLSTWGLGLALAVLAGLVAAMLGSSRVRSIAAFSASIMPVMTETMSLGSAGG